MAITIVPTILVNDQRQWHDRLRQLRDLGNRVQIDVIDGQFADNRTVEFSQMTGVEGLRLDIQLMVVEPVHWVERCRKLGASLVVGHVEKMTDQQQFVELVKMGNVKVGLALDLETDLSALDDCAILEIDHVLLMSVKAGFSGQLFQEVVLAKIKEVERLVGKQVEIGVDGGVNETNIAQVAQAGADVAYIGSALWQAKDIKAKLDALKAAAQST